MKIMKGRFGQFARLPNLRLGFYYEPPKCHYNYAPLTKVLSTIETGARPKGGISYLYEGQALSLGGEQIGINGRLNLENIPFIPHEFYMSRTKGRVKNSDILLCKDGAQTGKSCIVDLASVEYSEVMVNEHVFILRTNDLYRQEFLALVLRTPFFREQVYDLAFRKKAQPGLNLSHLSQIVIPMVPLEEQDGILQQLLDIEKRIDKLRERSGSIKTRLDKIIRLHIPIDENRLDEIDKCKVFYGKLSQASEINHLLRFSTRAEKARRILEDEKEQKIQFERMDQFILSTQNGWSPECNMTNTGYRVLGLDSINYSTVLRYGNCKYSDVERPNIESYAVHDGDLFLSRGNTIDLVALASVAYIDEKDGLIVFPDLMIRVTLNEKLNPRYVASIINSHIGRRYFKYASKGKNQTMVKISEQEIRDFLIPVIPLEKQAAIVRDIDGVITDQERLIKEIRDLHRLSRKTLVDAIWVQPVDGSELADETANV